MAWWSGVMDLCYERSGECIDLDLLELLYYTSADC
jgi:hypothetical protein